MDEKELVEKLAEAIWNHETAETIRREHKPANTQYAKWPTDSHRQPYCQSSYREAEALLPIIRAYVAERVKQGIELALEEHSAKTCPEDFNCETYIAELQRQLANLKAQQNERVKEAERESALNALIGFRDSHNCKEAEWPDVGSNWSESELDRRIAALEAKAIRAIPTDTALAKEK